MEKLRPYAWAWLADGAYYDFYNGRKPKDIPSPWKKGEGKWVKVVVRPYRGRK